MELATIVNSIHRSSVETLDGKTVVVVTSAGEPVSIGRFHVVRDPLLNQDERVELSFDTHLLSCRLRVPQAKVPEIKQSWNGETFRYELPAGDAAWLGPRDDAPIGGLVAPGSEVPLVEAFPLPAPLSKPVLPVAQAPWSGKKTSA